MCTHTHTHTYAQWNITQTIRIDEILPFTPTWVNLENIILSEVNQTEKDKYDIICMWNLKNNKNKLTYKTEIYSQTQKTNSVTKEERREHIN